MRWIKYLVLLGVLWPSTIHAQDYGLLDDWTECFIHREDGFTVNAPSEYYQVDASPVSSSSFLIGVSSSPALINVSTTYTGWICHDLSDGIVYLGSQNDGVSTNTTTYTYLRFGVGEDVVGFTMDCAYSGAKYVGSAQKIQALGNANITVNGGISQVGSTFTGSATVEVLSSDLAGAGRAIWDSQMIAPFAVPAGTTNTDGFWLHSYTSVGTSTSHFADNEIACSIQSVLTYDGSTTVEHLRPGLGWDYVPPTPTPVSGGTFTSTTWTSTPETVEIGLMSGSESCYVLLPAFTFGPYTVFGYELEAGWDDYELCVTSHDLSLVVYGVDYGALVLVVVSLGAFGILFSRL